MPPTKTYYKIGEVSDLLDVPISNSAIGRAGSLFSILQEQRKVRASTDTKM